MKKISWLVLGLLVVAGVGYGLSQKKASPPTFYFVKGKITSFDSTGAAKGQWQIVKQRGAKGPSKVIATLPTSVIGNGVPGVRLVSGQLEYTSMGTDDGHGNSQYEKDVYDLAGKQLSHQDVAYFYDPKTDNPLYRTLASSDGKWLASMDVICYVQNPEGPCHEDSKITLTDNATKKTFEVSGTSLKLANPGAKSLDIVAFSPNSSALYFTAHEQQEAGYYALMKMDTVTHAISTVWWNGVTVAGPAQMLNVVQKLLITTNYSTDAPPLVINGHVYFLRNDVTGTMMHLLQLDTAAGTLKELHSFDDFSYGTSSIDPTETYFMYSTSKGLVRYPLTGVTVASLMDVGMLRAWSSDGHFALSETNGTGTTDGFVINVVDGTSSRVYTQIVQGYQTTVNSGGNNIPKIADILYAFVGVE